MIPDRRSRENSVSVRKQHVVVMDFLHTHTKKQRICLAYRELHLQVPNGLSTTRKLSFAGTWMNYRLSVHVKLRRAPNSVVLSQLEASLFIGTLPGTSRGHSESLTLLSC